MKILIEFGKFFVYSLLIVVISKYILVPILRKFGESLDLKPKTIGNLSGIATSVPELLSVSSSAIVGLIGTSIYNIFSSNVINVIQYSLAVRMNKNGKVLQNKALKIDLILVLFTIIIPFLLIIFKIEVNITMVPIFILLFTLAYYLNHNGHKLYLKRQMSEELKKIEEETKWVKGKKKIMILYLIYLILIGLSLFIVGNLLGNTLQILSNIFKIPEFLLGIALGFITSIPELITFFESQKHHKINNDNASGVVEATNNLLTSNILNLFIIQSIALVLYQIYVT